MFTLLNEVSIEIIRKCPNNCVHCSSLSNQQCIEKIDYNHFVLIVNDAVKLGTRTICLSGGEPFLHDRIVDMILYISSIGLQSYVYTSGIVFDIDDQRTSLNRDVLEAISKNVTKLIFNVEASKPSTYDKIMGTTGCFDKMKQSIYDANSFSITTEAHFVPMKLNISEVKDVVSLCKELNVSKLSFLRLVLHGRALMNESEIALSSKELDRFKKELTELKNTSEIGIRIGVPLAIGISHHKCEAADGKLNIKYDGNVFPCEIFKNNCISHSLRGTRPESIHDKSLFDIYNNSAYLQLVRELSQKFSSCDGYCETCMGQYLINIKEPDYHDK